jgi:S1-C subfamily serine protease
LSAGEIFETYSDSVVLLENYDEDNQLALTGSGFCVGESLVATNYHVVRGAARLLAKDKDATRYEASEVQSYDIGSDLAIIEFANLHLKPLVLGDSTTLKRGDHVTVIGAPLGIQNTLSDGITTNLAMVGGVNMIQTSAPISHGSSGGPLFDDRGRVIGVASAMKPGGELVNFAIPSVTLQQLLRKPTPLELSQVLAQTRIVSQILQGDSTVEGTVVRLAFSVPLDPEYPDREAVVQGNFDAGPEYRWALIQTVPNGQTVEVTPVRACSYQSSIRQSLPAGDYAFVFDNVSARRGYLMLGLPQMQLGTKIAGNITLTYFR